MTIIIEELLTNNEFQDIVFNIVFFLYYFLLICINTEPKKGN